MALKAVYEKKEEIPASLQEHYVERNGKFELNAEGMKTQADVDRVLEGIRKEREEHDKTRAALKAWGDLKHEEVVQKLDRLPELEAAAAGKIDEKKLDEMVELRVKGRVTPVERKLAEAAQREREKDEKIAALMSDRNRRKVEDAVRAAALKLKVDVRAMDDVFLNASTMLSVAEDGKTIAARDGVGVTPGIDPETWLMEMQQKRPLWWGVSVGGGANGGGNGPGLANPWTADGWNVTAQGQFARQHGEAKARDMAKAAGVNFDKPMRPAKKP